MKVLLNFFFFFFSFFFFYQEFNSTQCKKRRKTKKASFPKESVENADLYKPVFDKIMIIHE